MSRHSLARTLGGAIAVLVAATLARMAAMLAAASAVGADTSSLDPAQRHDGLLAGVGLLAGALAGTLTLLPFVRRELRQGLALEWPGARATATWLGAGVALSAASDAAAWLAGRPLVLPEWVDAYRTAPVALLAVALVAASVFEELFFRGFLQGGLSATRLGPAGAIPAVALLFALAHFPADAWRLLDVFAVGVLLGVARHVTRSSLSGMLPHIVGNLKVLLVIALLEP